ncbi:response regulator [Azospirillum thermophilum]|uniref:response regulator n=1 Tax=Azospirillum thermophilum TaxID=2202148 RepID=UPI00143D2DFB|nr:response regulator [Azospirillum thermophilum]
MLAPAGRDGAGGGAGGRPVLRVLVAEDEAITAMHIEDILLELGHEVVGTVDNGPDAVAAAGRLRPDLMLMDIRLARDSDGIAAATEVYRALGIRSVFLSAHSDTLTRERAAAALPLGFAVKPFSTSQLAVLLDGVCEALGRKG